MNPRSIRADVRNPLIRLPSAQRIRSLSPECRAALDGILVELRADCRANADKAWRKHKAPMAAYWKAASVYVGHLRKLTREPRSQAEYDAAHGLSFAGQAGVAS